MGWVLSICFFFSWFVLANSICMHTHDSNPGFTCTENMQSPKAHRQTVKQLDWMWGDGHWWRHKPYICLTADISEPLRKQDEASSDGG